MGLDEPDETPDELAADNVDMEPFDESGCNGNVRNKYIKSQLYFSYFTFR